MSSTVRHSDRGEPAFLSLAERRTWPGAHGSTVAYAVRAAEPGTFLWVRPAWPGIRVHDLRHAAASLAFEAGASVEEVQAMLKHTRQATTADVYVHVMESVRQGTASKMDDVRSSAS